MLLGLLITLSAWTSTWPQGRIRDAESTPLKPVGAQMHVTVHEGYLSVHLREALVREVLAAIGQQAGLRVRIDAAANRTVNAQFMATELDQGLRRLLQAAALNYAFLYIRGPAATAILHEVRVFGEERHEGPANHDRAPVELAQRAAARPISPPQEEPAEPQLTEPEQETDALAEPEPEAVAPED
jgi:type II secretory pathway component GspD/PulD (secretin)